MNTMVRVCVLSACAMLSACAHEAYHFNAAASDYAALGLDGDTVVPREDGRRSRAGTDDYEWWYLDGVAKDGTVVVAVFSDNWLPGTHARHVMLDVTLPGKATRTVVFSTKEPGHFATDHADVTIGKSRFTGDLARYEVKVDAAELKGVGADLVLERRAPSWRPGTGHMRSGDDFFAWVVPVPEGRLTGTLTIDGQTVEFEGSGYHDHNWGNAPPWALMRNWWWGRGEVEGQTVVMSEMRPAPGRGEKTAPLLFVGGPEGIVESAWGDQVRFEEGAAFDNEDITHREQRAREVHLTTPKVTAKFERQGAPITTADLLAGRTRFERWLAHMAGRSPWYTRWRAKVTLKRGDVETVGTGTLEFMDLE